jgi:hypothetical protein
MNLNINTNALEELKKRKFAVVYGANETGKTYFVNQKNKPLSLKVYLRN